MIAHAGTPALRLLHSMPGRLRLRLPAAVDPTPVMSAIEASDGVVSAVWTPRTRSLLVHYRADVVDEATIVDAVAAHAGVEPGREHATEKAGSPVTRAANGATQSPVAVAVQQTAREFDVAVRRHTAGLLDLGILFPLALGGWAALELVRGRVGPLAWSSALWYAHGLFRDYSLPER